MFEKRQGPASFSSFKSAINCFNRIYFICLSAYPRATMGGKGSRGRRREGQHIELRGVFLLAARVSVPISSCSALDQLGYIELGGDQASRK